MEHRLDRIIKLADSILGRLNSEERLSNILPQIRLLADMCGDGAFVAWTDAEIYGILRVPLAPLPREKAEDKQGGVLFAKLHQMPDIGSMDYREDILNAFKSQSLSKYDKVSTLSIRDLEEVKHEELPGHQHDRVYADFSYRAKIFEQEAGKIVARVRAFAHEYVGKVWQETIQEKENQSILGPDYKIVVNNLNALKTGVGQELIAVLANLRNSNPANWALAALGCRNVIIKLGEILWKAPCGKYLSELDNKELDLVGEKEKNKLFAYIGYHHKLIQEQEQKDTLKSLHDKLWVIYKTGSKGKRSIRHEEAKIVVVDTFEFVSTLDDITGLKPLEDI